MVQKEAMRRDANKERDCSGELHQPKMVGLRLQNATNSNIKFRISLFIIRNASQTLTWRCLLFTCGCVRCSCLFRRAIANHLCYEWWPASIAHLPLQHCFLDVYTTTKAARRARGPMRTGTTTRRASSSPPPTTCDANDQTSSRCRTRTTTFLQRSLT